MEVVHPALGRADVRGILEQAFGQRVIRRGKPRGQVETPLQIPDALTGLEQFLGARVRQHWADQAYWRLLNRMLFLAAEPDQRYVVMQRLSELRGKKDAAQPTETAA